MPKLSVTAPQVDVYINGKLEPDVHLLSATLSAGARNLANAQIILEPTLRKKGRSRLLNQFLVEFEQAEVEVVIDGNFRSVVHWGKILSKDARLDEAGDGMIYTSRIDDQHFGVPLTVSYYWHPKESRVVAHDLPTVLNPDYDGKSAKNMATRRAPGAMRYRLLLHPDSTQTTTATTYNAAGKPGYWTLPEAVFYLCATLNRAQTYIKNPTLAELNAILPKSESLIRNHECRLGAYLPEQLDNLLEPLGFSWTVDFLARGNRKIRVFRRGKGRDNPLYLQPPGSVVDLNLSNLEQCTFKADVADRAFNQVTVLGDYEQYESTFLLVPAWEKKYDNRDVNDFQKNAEGWATTPALERVWRDWVLNEAGDYIGFRKKIQQAYNFDAIFGKGKWIPRRRKFEPCLTLNHDGSPKGHSSGVYVEWFDKIGDGQWHPIDDLAPEGRSIRVLERECGIRFDGLEVPRQIRAMVNHLDLPLIRVTAVVRSDTRLKRVQSAYNAQNSSKPIPDRDGNAEPPQRAGTILRDLKEEIIDVASRFKYRQRSKVTPKSRFNVDQFKVDEADDRRSADDTGKQLLTAWNAATISGKATITGIDYNFRQAVGTIVTGIVGRDVSFDNAALDPLYPNIMSITIRPTDQVTELSLDTPQGDQAYIERHTDLRSGKRRRK